jgi:hypothetical protein
MGHLPALEKYLNTHRDLGLQTKEFDVIRRKHGSNVFRPLKLTSLRETLYIMASDISL